MKDFEARKGLIRMASGQEPADTLIRDGSVVNVLTGEVLPRDIAIKDGRIAAVANDVDQFRGDSTEILDAEGLYLTPGFIDAHLHVESSLLSPVKFAELMASKGVTAVFYDPHEIANVSGIKGVRWMYDELEKTPLISFLTVPSCVPASSPALETAGAEFGIKEIDRALGWEKTAALGEMMNFPGVLSLNEETLEKIEKAFEHGLPVEGHASGLAGDKLDGYGSAGIESDHEAVTKEEGIERGRKGFWTYIREGSGWADVKEVVRALTETKVLPRRYCLVTDDRDVIDLIEEGGVDHVIRRAMEEGLDPVEAIAMASLNPATRFGMGAELGSLSPGRRADINLVSDLESLKVEKTLLAGKSVEEIDWPKTSASAQTGTARVEREITPRTFEIREDERQYGIRVKDQDVTTEKIETSKLEESRLDRCAVIERHRGTGNVGRGLVEGFNLGRGAIASTVAHDSHNLVVLGKNGEDMSVAANYLVEVGGGQAVVEGGEVKAAVKLPVAGLMSDLAPNEVASSLREVKKAVEKIGCELSQPLMILSSLALAVIPEVRLTDKGLVDVNSQEIIN
ncbi:adenine deaminase [Candidatus Bipolaricaulota bacterium]|nr:adenine deaminase [Candidatus Bipolaricaulota bacterium]